MRTAPILRLFLPSLCVLTVTLSSGCASFRTPGAAADFNILADDDIQEILARKPASPIPAHLAVARIQASAYRSRTAKGYGTGKYSVVTVRDIETKEDFERLGTLPQVLQVAPLNRMLLSEHLESDRQLRQAAASIHADLLLLYTFDTSFFVGDVLPPLSVVTLGLSPNQTAEVTTTASAVLMDVRTGYVYGTCETTSRKNQLASAWTSGEAVDLMRLKTERKAFEELLGDIESLWNEVVIENKAGTTAKMVGG